jgi:ParB-like chromosome segregation protein Spo0J
MNMPINDTAMVTAARLHVAPENPRSAESADAREVADLAGNIAALGLLTPLIAYREGADFFVTAGGRRTRALHALLNERRIADTATFPVSVLDKEAAINAGHAEQLTHAVMSDLDTLRVFRRPEYEH